MGAKRGIEVRGNSIRMAFVYQGQRYRETVKIPPTPANMKYVERWRQTILHEIATGRFDYAKHFPESPRARAHRPGSSISVADALSDWLRSAQRSSARSTLEDYRNTVHNHLVPAFGSYRLSEMTTTYVKAWIAQLGCGAKRVNNLLIPLRGMLGDAYADGLIDHNPMARVRNLRSTSTHEPDPFTPDEVSRILSACDGQMRHLIQFAFTTGLRTGELLGLRWGDIDLDKGIASIRRSMIKGHEEERTKTRSGRREVVLLPLALDALQQQAPYTYVAGERVFGDPVTGKQWESSKQIQRRWIRILRRAKVRYRNPYQTRHTYASMLLTAGEHPMWVAQQMGHRDWGMLRKVYGRWITDAQPDAGARAASAMGHGWGIAETIRDNQRHIKSVVTPVKPLVSLTKWRSGRDSNPRPPA